ncbi:MAG: formate--tetrahydrofolate ligase, partial [Halobacteriales archaeon]
MSSEDSDSGFPTDYEIAQSVDKEHIRDVVEPFGLGADDLELYGEYKAKVTTDAVERIVDQ